MNCNNPVHNIQVKQDGRCHWCEGKEEQEEPRDLAKPNAEPLLTDVRELLEAIDRMAKMMSDKELLMLSADSAVIIVDVKTKADKIR
jgi:hypothetical protein